MTATFGLRTAHFRVASLERSLRFYRDVLGMVPSLADDHTVQLQMPDQTGATPPALMLEADATATPKPARVPGLFHLAWLLPDRASLARVIRQLVLHRYPIQGASDHGVSEAFYLSDPDGIGLELYVDRPADVWPRIPKTGELAMVTEALDIDDLLASDPTGAASGFAPGTRIGHVHLRVANLAASEHFYTGKFGMALIQRYGPAAAFVAADGYHHHFGLNTWSGPAITTPNTYADLVRLDVAYGNSATALTDPQGLRLEVTPI